MAYLWRLGDFISGEITRPEPLPVTRGASEVELDIHSEDGTKLVIPLGSLSAQERNDWHGNFHELQKFCVLENNAVAWDAPGAVLFAGFVNKITPKLSPQTIELQLTGMEEYSKARIVGETFDTKVTDPTKAVDFEAGTWQGVMNAMIKRMFDNSLIPAGLPRNPAVLGSVGDSTGTGKKKSILITEAVSYGAALKQISETESGLGLEYRFVPRWASSAKNKVVWDFITGTEQYPHINEANTVAITLAENSEKISSWDTTIDSNDLYSSLYLQSKGGSDETKDGADFTGKALTAQRFPILVERFFNPGVELTDGQIEEQLNARIEFAGRSKYTAGFTVEEKGNPSQWIQRIGATLNIEGLPDTISAGHTANLRCVGISFTPGKGTISVEVMQKQPVYPRLPKKNLSDLISGGNKDNNDNTRIPSGSGGSGGGGGVAPVIPEIPEIPDAGWTNEGVFNNSDLWGGEGRDPDDGPLKMIAAPDFEDLKSIAYDTNLPGLFAIDPDSMIQDKGNRVYGLDRVTDSFASKFTPGGSDEHWKGGMDRGTGLPIRGWAPLYIRKTSLTKTGEMGPLETVDVITPEMLNGFMSEWEDQNYSVTSYYRTGFFYSNWIGGDDRYYIALGHKYDHSIAEREPSYSILSSRYITNGKITILSKKINMGSGKFEGDWREEKEIGKWLFPRTHGVARYGTVAVFTAFSIFITDKLKNQNWRTLQEDLYNRGEITYEGRDLNPRNDGLYVAPPVEGLIDSNNDASRWPFVAVYNAGGYENHFYRDYSSGENYHRINIKSGVNGWGNGFTSGAGVRVYRGVLYKEYYRARVEPKSVSNNIRWVENPKTAGDSRPATVWPSAPCRGWMLLHTSTVNSPAAIRASEDQENFADNTNVVSLRESLFSSFSFRQNDSNRAQMGGYYNSFDQGYATSSSNKTKAVKISQIFSYNSRLFQFALGGPKKTILRSIRMKEKDTMLPGMPGISIGMG